jgi:NAD-dependent SIR2 family protein deacetylase
MDIPQELVQDLARGNAVLFAGAGLSTAAGLPGWVDLVRPLAVAVDNPLPPDPYITSDHLLDATQYYENAKGRHALISYLQEQLDTTLHQPSPNHALLARLPVQTIFTTNYDDLIERSLQLSLIHI